MEITLRPTLKQHLAYQALNNQKVSEVFLGGGAGGGKTWLICESRLVNALRYPGYRSYIGREELKRLMQSTYVTWTKVCKYHCIKQGEFWDLNGQYNYIEFKNGSRIDLLDMKYLPSDPLYERFGSLEYSDGAIEEAGEVHPLGADVIKSRVGRHLNKEFGIIPNTLITGNPKKNWTYTDYYKPWKNGVLPENIVFIQSLYNDNEHTAEEYGKVLAAIKDPIIRARLKDGIWEYDEDQDSLIRYDNIVDIFTNTVVAGDKYITADIARYGKDRTVIAVWLGFKIYKWLVIDKSGIDTVAEIIKNLAREENVPYSHILADEDGVGGGVIDILRGIKGFIANSSPLEDRKASKILQVKNGSLVQLSIKDNFQNLKTQCSYKLADIINDHKLSIELNGQLPASLSWETVKEMIIQEVEFIKTKDSDKEGKLKIMSKDEIKERIGRSPDFSDSIMMRMFFELSPATSSTPTFSGLGQKSTFR